MSFKISTVIHSINISVQQDIASDELCKSVKHIQLHRVQNLLQLAVQTSTLASDAHREGLTCTLETHNLIQHLHLIQVSE